MAQNVPLFNSSLDRSARLERILQALEAETGCALFHGGCRHRPERLPAGNTQGRGDATPSEAQRGCPLPAEGIHQHQAVRRGGRVGGPAAAAVLQGADLPPGGEVRLQGRQQRALTRQGGQASAALTTLTARRRQAVPPQAILPAKVWRRSRFPATRVP